MLIKPLNRHLLVALQTAEERSSAVLLPEDFKEEKERYSIAKIITTSDDCKPALRRAALNPPKNILIQTDMVDAVVVAGTTFHFILENYVLGIVET